MVHGSIERQHSQYSAFLDRFAKIPRSGVHLLSCQEPDKNLSSSELEMGFKNVSMPLGCITKLELAAGSGFMAKFSALSKFVFYSQSILAGTAAAQLHVATDQEKF